ncbi:MAG: aminodeoxychorismate lyase [Candidatus Thiosymbion ectosymbiont of Robbea hypermnestra]|nr:aminodeoxychorismate lyase [Candidatus Thiosymbion ectosymbiont of Robbea hypermnestra]
MAPDTLIDGVATDRLAVADRGLQYGDGLFETLAVQDGAPCLWREHYHRLARGAERLGIPCPPPELLLRESRQLADGASAAVLKIILTRGHGGRGYRPPEDPRPTRILRRHPWPDHPRTWEKQGVAVTFCRTPLGENPRLAGLKHLNRLEQVLARSEWRDREIAEGLMQDGRGRIIGGTLSNLFLARAGCLLTPRLDTCGIAGTVRGLVLRLAAGFGIQVLERNLGRADLTGADGLFLTNALIGVWPVRRLGTREMNLDHLPWELITAVRRAARTPDRGRNT